MRQIQDTSPLVELHSLPSPLRPVDYGAAIRSTWPDWFSTVHPGNLMESDLPSILSRCEAIVKAREDALKEPPTDYKSWMQAQITSVVCNMLKMEDGYSATVHALIGPLFKSFNVVPETSPPHPGRAIGSEDKVHINELACRAAANLSNQMARELGEHALAAKAQLATAQAESPVPAPLTLFAGIPQVDGPPSARFSMVDGKPKLPRHMRPQGTFTSFTWFMHVPYGACAEKAKACLLEACRRDTTSLFDGMGPDDSIVWRRRPVWISEDERSSNSHRLSLVFRMATTMQVGHSLIPPDIAIAVPYHE